jgi:hypothetical protein
MRAFAYMAEDVDGDRKWGERWALAESVAENGRVSDRDAGIDSICRRKWQRMDCEMEIDGTCGTSTDGMTFWTGRVGNRTEKALGVQ